MNDVAAGQIRRLAPAVGAAPARVVLVMDVNDDYKVARVMVLSPEVEMGADADRLLNRSATGLPYDVIALTDVFGPAGLSQLGPVLGQLAPPPSKRFAHRHSSLDLDAFPPAGIPYRDGLDARWAWKVAELDALVALTMHARRRAVDGEVEES